MPDAVALRTEAAASTATANRCEVLATEIERRRLLLSTRLDPVRTHHRPDVWQSRAAESSRAMLDRYIAPGLWFLGEDLGRTARLLRERAHHLTIRSAGLLATATEIESTADDHTPILGV